MLEQILKRKPPTFTAGTVRDVDTARQRALVELQSGLTSWMGYGRVDPPGVGESVIVARDRQRFIVQRAADQPPGETLIEV